MHRFYWAEVAGHRYVIAIRSGDPSGVPDGCEPVWISTVRPVGGQEGGTVLAEVEHPSEQGAMLAAVEQVLAPRHPGRVARVSGPFEVDGSSN